MASKTLQLEILSVGTPIFTKTARGGYNSLEIAYKNRTFENKVEGKKVVDFNDKVVFEFLKTLKQGDVIDVVAEKGDNDQFWKWVSAGYTSDAERASLSQSSGNVSGGESSTTSAPQGSRSVGRTVGNNYETPEERARKQVYIVRQSSFSTALEFLKENDPERNELSDVFDVAKKIEEYVLAGYDIKKDGVFKE